MNKYYLKRLIDTCWCLDGYTPEELENVLLLYGVNELTGNLWEDVPYIEKEFPFAKSCYENEIACED